MVILSDEAAVKNQAFIRAELMPGNALKVAVCEHIVLIECLSVKTF